MMTTINYGTTQEKESGANEVSKTCQQEAQEDAVNNLSHQEAHDTEVHIKLLQDSNEQKVSRKILNSPTEGSQPENTQRATQLINRTSPPRLVPPDGGWGWLVVFGGLINLLLATSVVSCFSIAFFQILVGFEASTATTGWIVSIQSFLWNMTGPFAMPLVAEFGWRKVAYLGVLLISLAYVSSAYTPSAEFLFFSFSFLNGVGCGLLATIAFNIVPQYFLRRRGIANGFLMGGISIGQIFGPPFVRLLQEQYSSKGALIILAAVTLNGFVGICFFHPVSWHMKRDSEEKNDTGMKETDAGSMENKSRIQSSQRFSLNQNVDHLVEARRASMYASSVSLSASVSLPTLKTFEEKEEIPRATTGKDASKWEAAIRFARSFVSNMKVMRSKRALIINVGIAFVVISHINFCMLVPFSIRAGGHSLQDASYAFSVMGVCSLMARLIGSPMTDCAWFNMRITFMASQAALSFFMLVFPFVEELNWIYIVMGCYGCSIGMNISLNHLVMIKYMGLERLPSMVGASQLFKGFGVLAAGPIVGLIRDLTQSYAVSIWILSCCVFCSFLIWFLMPAAVAHDLKQETTIDGSRS